ncbi:Superfamily II DNA and RNA helicase [Paenibacillus sp. UNCCL117]|uniref:DEAD/DEAH box helicase n=1 Tax=unclassified Paenibacillus TaxID=185978 RepID=UPI00088FC425|nr:MULTISPECIES: DEAD/DEAH box helicase [unclassified Paenibacillus]SDD71849.1 Superfamily II DNA and RNA helicase [Paenibacillus sp. cl123]SFW45618.1 Superfamily II DNA and RNA helicase [Paenibacillus sp. UNCCL117]
MNTGFASLGIDSSYVKRLAELGITEPSPIQAEAIPLALQRKDIVAQSQTGTGKTLAFALPALQHIDVSLREAQVMVLVPTRELGMQIVHTLDQLTQGTEVRVQQLIGGASIERQIDKLKLKPHIVVGTPGRVQELVKLRKLKLAGIRTLIVDEVDQVFELGSMHEVEALLKGMLRDRQMLFFSATFPPQLQAVIEHWMREPEYVRVNPAQRTAETLEHIYFVCEERERIDTLRRLVRLWNPKQAIVFINETDDIGEAVAKLKYVGLSVEGLYADSYKQERARAMQGFRAGRFQLLLATDVAARGLDLPEVTHVFNLDPPIDADHYVHRVGRTGRMGRKGTAVSIITRKEQFIVDKFAKSLGIDIQRKYMSHGKVYDARPSGEAVAEKRKPAESRPAQSSPEARIASAAPPASSQRHDAAAGETAPRAQGRGGAKPAGAGRDAAPGVVPPGGAKGRPADRPKRPVKSKAELERERKNKGAPRWLKDKPARPGKTK